MTETRSELLERATVFLKDTQQAPLAQRISFLESKGLTQSEIQIALTTPLKNTQIPPRPQPVTSKWPSIWWGPVALLALRYFIKYFNFPTPQSLQNETAAQKKEIEQSALNLVNLNDQTKKLYKLLETHSIKVTESLTKTQETLKTLEINNEIVKKRMEEIEKELESIKDCIPKFLEKTRENQEGVIDELAIEIKSMKKLLVSKISTNLKHGVRNENKNVPKPSIPEWQRSLPITDTEIPDSITTHHQNEKSVYDDLVNSNPDQITSSTKPFIPAWQLEAASAIHDISNVKNSNSLISNDNTGSNSPIVEEIDDHITDKESHDSIDHHSTSSSKPHIPAWQLEGASGMKDKSHPKSLISNVSSESDSPKIEEIGDAL